MNLLKKFNQEDISRLCPYAQMLLEKLVPMLQKIDSAKIGEESKIEIIQIEKDWSLYSLIKPRDKNIPALTLYASTTLCVLGYTDCEQLVCHKDPASDADNLIEEIIDCTSKYLTELQLLNTEI